MTIEQIRAESKAFDEWAMTANPVYISLKKFDDGEILTYLSPNVELMFQCWLAAKRHGEQSVWIPVTEKYPEERKQEVIVKLSDGAVKIALYSRWTPYGQTQSIHYFEGDIEHVDGGEYNATTFENVEYWQPLPN